MTHKILVVYPELDMSNHIFMYAHKPTLKELQERVGGYIEPCAPLELREKNIELLVDEEGLLKGLQPNAKLYPFFYVGNAVFVGLDVEEVDGVKEVDFVGLTVEQIEFIVDWLEGLGA